MAANPNRGPHVDYDRQNMGFALETMISSKPDFVAAWTINYSIEKTVKFLGKHGYEYEMA